MPNGARRGGTERKVVLVWNTFTALQPNPFSRVLCVCMPEAIMSIAAGKARLVTSRMATGGSRWGGAEVEIEVADSGTKLIGSCRV